MNIHFQVWFRVYMKPFVTGLLVVGKFGCLISRHNTLFYKPAV